MTTGIDPGLVPELLVRNIKASIGFWCALCGFEIRYDRPDESFAYITLGMAHLMLEQADVGRSWITGPLQVPYGRGVNFQVAVPDVEPILAALREADVSLFMQPETKWYRMADQEAGVRQFLVTDPDGYLIRFQSSIGRRGRTDGGLA
ncbi:MULTISPECIES: bleomycin resistance protein [Cryobacterium]|uniref:Bleomycin resistance protein n=1 Tax=Cryobacterium shii TaxID=1259235 RepID=A0AAQ2HES3_9MICO|nr:MULTISPECIES: VOC family protein [Cryobacterium]TFC42508.1 VOC family protein [Cryobacterium shii]TFD28455.1 VOC family protein [Cryobacterium sp. TMT2-23]